MFAVTLNLDPEKLQRSEDSTKAKKGSSKTAKTDKSTKTSAKKSSDS